MCPAELSTPQTFVSSGEWRVRSKHIEMDTKLLTSPAPAEHHSLQIVKLTRDSLLAKPAAEPEVQFQRLDAPSCRSAGAASPAIAVEPNIVGTWQVHYHTHEFRYRFAPDHTVAVSGLVLGRFDPLWKGSWSVSGGDLLMELQPDSRGMGEQKPRWKLYGFQRDCFWVKDPDGIDYAVHRTE
jgi:hypothetical protein